MKKRLLSLMLMVIAVTLPTTLLAQATVGDETLEPYAVLSENNTVLTFYYDDQKEARNGMSVGPFSWGDKERWGGHYPDIVTVVFDESFANCTSITSTASWFRECGNLKAITGLEHLKTDNVTDMAYMFYLCSGLTSLDVSGFNTESVKSMLQMFCGCSNLTNLDLSGFKTDAVEDLSQMFYSCSGLKNLDVSGFNTNHVTNFESMFDGCSGLTSLNVSGFNTVNVTKMNSMFDGCSSLKSLDISSFNTSNVTDMSWMFGSCSELTTIYAGNDWSTAAVTNGDNMFTASIKLVGGKGTTYDSDNTDHTYARIDGGTSNPGYFTDIADATVVTNPEPYAVLSEDSLTVTFYYDGQKAARNGMDAGPFQYGFAQTWHIDREKITTVIFDDSFAECKTLTSTALWFHMFTHLTTIIGINNLKTDNVTDMCRMFDGCYSLSNLDVSGFKTDNVTDMSYLFSNCYSVTDLNVSGFNTANVTDMSSMFTGCSSLSNLDVSGFQTDNVTGMSGMFSGCSALTSLDLSNFNTANVTGMSSMFEYCSALTSLDLSNFNTVNVTDMNSMFHACSSLTSLDVSGFKTDNVTDMSSMFWACSGLTSLDVSGFKTDNVTGMWSMFSGCSGLTSLDVSGFKTDNVTDMGSMFSGCSRLTSLDLSGFKTDNVTDMWSMFSDCSGLASLDVSGFMTDNVTYMNWMFSGCSGLTSLDVCGFKTDKVTDMSYMFSGCSILKTIYADEGWTTSNVTSSSSMFAHCTKLVGGKGTAYDGNHTDATYARIDGGPNSETPGYFTRSGDAPYVAPEPYAVLTGSPISPSGDKPVISVADVMVVPGKTTSFSVNLVDGKADTYLGIQFDVNFPTPGFTTTEDYSVSSLWAGNVSGGVGQVGSKEPGQCTCAFHSLTIDGFIPGSTVDSLVTVFLKVDESVPFGEYEVTLKDFMIVAEGSKDYADDVTFKVKVVDQATYDSNATIPSTINVSGSNGYTLTFYYDNQKESRGGISFLNGTDVNWPSSITSVTKVSFDESFVDFLPTSTSNWFAGFNNLTSIEGMEYLNTAHVTHMSGMFTSCYQLKNLDVSGFKTDNVTDMSYMFFQCSDLTSLDLSGFKTDNMTDMKGMFWDCSCLTSLDLRGFNTANVMDMSYMFFHCTSLATIYVGDGWTTASVTSDGGVNMFADCLYLVGGKGTAYDANHTDETYAHIDGGPSNPGYLTQALAMGDANGDGSINIADAVATVTNILGQPTDGNFYKYAADMNTDNVIDIFDVTMIVNAAFDAASPALAMTRGSAGNIMMEHISMTADANHIYMGLDQPERFTATQFDVTLPEGMELVDVRLASPTTDHQLSFVKRGENEYRVIGLSMSNATFRSVNCQLMKLEVSDTAVDGDVKMSNVLFVTPTAMVITSVDKCLNTARAADDSLYDLNGRKLDNSKQQLGKGIYIMNHKKVIIK